MKIAIIDCGIKWDETDLADKAYLNAAELAKLGDPITKDTAAMQPGDLLVFDNLTLAHGRSGKRRPGELRQRVFGCKDLSPAGQLELRDCVLGAFDAPYDAVGGDDVAVLLLTPVQRLARL